MNNDVTFTMIKPGAVNHEFIGPILTMINDAGFKIIAMRFTKLTIEEAEAFYSMHRDKHFFGELVKFITSAPVVAMILQKENAVADYRRLIGDTDPSKAAPGTIRALYAEDIEHNAVHGSDTDENARRECDFFFSMRERYADYPVIHTIKRRSV